MNKDIPTFSKKLESLSTHGLFNTLPGIRRGLEKETLRVSPDGTLAQTRHPLSLGSSLTHPHITTDYAESLLEFISTPWTSVQALLTEITDMETFTHHCIQPLQEQLWATSMPCRLPDNPLDIPIAQYGTAYAGQIKTIYRHGLGLRYGRKMQTIAGIHYNFSLPDTFWQCYQSISASPVSVADKGSALTHFISDQYFHLIRNVLRWRWLLPLWFGASPALDNSFLSTNTPASIVPFLTQEKNGTWISPYATSLRLSPLGYSNNHQSPVRHTISYQHLSEFTADLQKAITTVSPEFSTFGIVKNGHYQQLNNTDLQIENEFYGLIRPKNTLNPQERLLHALKHRGVGYLELRALDLNPFEPSGIASNGFPILEVFLTTCLFLNSPPLSAEAENKSHEDYQKVVLLGRQKGLTLSENAKGKRETLIQRAMPFLDALQAVAEYFDQTFHSTAYSTAINTAIAQIHQPDASLSAQVWDAYAQHNNSHIDFGCHYSQQHAHYFGKKSLSEEKKRNFKHMAEQSLQQQQVLERQKEPAFEEYLSHYLHNIN